MPETHEKDRSQELDFTPVEGEKPVPIGWRILFWGLIAFGAVYLWLYSPWSTGWTQSGELDRAGEAAAGAGGNVFATILFTALAVAAAVIILFAMARRKRQP
jgi:hypothetical protein